MELSLHVHFKMWPLICTGPDRTLSCDTFKNTESETPVAISCWYSSYNDDLGEQYMMLLVCVETDKICKYKCGF